ncbi:hypothetical protein HYPSUDRAFT_149461 [Hypholoma sublateritium FD-334 SS-4]|uniref:Ketoreductase (KR) domain-containing protein n=1 Tax=Hypholoma sublateritium (strain FD-334 SS-4) TaxID=945553 RepID=A0A0D2N819_HYPSF|nr:hypothetical protein HYPSUDRAFT_149461 [Hypholoma sublateritium FD-334 SS-4]
MFPFSPLFSPEGNLPDLTGKVVFVTGANHGIGYKTVKHLARRGAKVYLGSRSEAKGLAAVASLEQELAKGAMKSLMPGKVIYHHCELSSPTKAREAAQKLEEIESRLDILSAFLIVFLDQHTD